jgi:hypothetical protein
MAKSGLENKVKELFSSTAEISSRACRVTLSGLEFARDRYERLHAAHPLLTNYLSSAVGTVGGDAIAKQFTEDPNVSLRDISFTASAAVVYSYLAPKMIEWSSKITDKVSRTWKQLKENNKLHRVFNTSALTLMYFPVNMVYWNYLTIKNEAPITFEDNLAGLAALSIATIPYWAADYIALEKFSQPETKKWLRPFYSGVEVVWNTLFASGNYLAKKI